MNELSHVDAEGRLQMVDVGAKEVSRRRAVARATLTVKPETGFWRGPAQTKPSRFSSCSTSIDTSALPPPCGAVP